MTLDSETGYAVSDSADTVDGGTVTITLDGKTAHRAAKPERDPAGKRAPRRTGPAVHLRGRQLRHLHGHC